MKKKIRNFLRIFIFCSIFFDIDFDRIFSLFVNEEPSPVAPKEGKRMSECKWKIVQIIYLFVFSHSLKISIWLEKDH